MVSLHLIEFHGSLHVLERFAVAVGRHQGGVLLALAQGARLGGGQAGGVGWRVALVEVVGCCCADEQKSGHGQEKASQAARRRRSSHLGERGVVRLMEGESGVDAGGGGEGTRSVGSHNS